MTQTDSNGDQHPVAFLSKTFTEMERNYEIYDRELLGIIRALEEWRHYIQGSGHTTTVYSDHQNLTFFKSAQKLNHRQARWALYLSEFDIKLIHMPGSKMIQLGTLSRQPDFILEEDHDNENRILLLENMFINLIDLDLQDRIAKSKNYDFDVQNALEILLEKGPNTLQSDLEDWKLEKHNSKNVMLKKLHPK